MLDNPHIRMPCFDGTLVSGSAVETTLTITIGGDCPSHVVTKLIS
jgi:hypothetical protein